MIIVIAMEYVSRPLFFIHFEGSFTLALHSNRDIYLSGAYLGWTRFPKGRFIVIYDIEASNLEVLNDRR